MSGAFVVSITPFLATGELDEAGLRFHLRRMAAAGIGVYVGGSGSGEGNTLSPQERGRLFTIAVEELSGRVPVRAMGVEPRSAAAMIDEATAAANAGLDAVQVYSLDLGHGHQPTPAEVERYLGDVLSAVELPIVVSTHQSAGYRIDPDLLASLAAEHDHFIGVNCTHPDLDYLARVIDAMGSRPVYVGGPGQALTAMSLGATGYLSSEANLSPGLCASVAKYYDAGDLRNTTSLFGTLLRLSALLYANGGIRATKAVLAALGLPGGYPRLPQLPLPPERAAALIDAVRGMGALRAEDPRSLSSP